MCFDLVLRAAPEYWADIPNFPHYQVSSYGNVRNFKTGKLLKPYLTRGYLRVSLYNQTGRKCKLIHRLVAQAFLPNRDNKPAVNHINGCKTNNNLNNLEWVTASENMSHAHYNGLRPKLNTQGEKNGFAKLSLFQATEIKRLARKGILTQKEIALRFNISRHTVQDIKSGKRWKHIV